MATLATAAVCFITFHGGPAAHFADWAPQLAKEGITVEIYASGVATDKFKDQNSHQFSIEADQAIQDLAQEIFNTSKNYQKFTVITDLGHSYAPAVLEALAAHNLRTWVYYDNPESFVPGGYSTEAEKAMQVAPRILFANTHLALGLGDKPRIGLGYFPLAPIAAMKKRRQAEQTSLRAQLLPDYADKKILVYFGGNNSDYFEKALPAFFKILSDTIQEQDLSQFAIVIQQHPGAKSKKFEDPLVANWVKETSHNPNAPSLILSTFNSNDAQVIADGAFYHQTTMNAQFLLAGIPTVQIAHERYDDTLVKQGVIPSVTTADELKKVISQWAQPNQQPSISEKQVLAALGHSSKWFQTLKNVVLCDD